MQPFRDRSDAGRVLAESLAQYAGLPEVVVLGLARGGVPVARSVADALGTTPSVLIPRRLTIPGVEEVALGAIVEGSGRIIVDTAAQHIGVPARLLERLAVMERVDLERCASLYHAGSPPPDLRGRIVLLVDDGVATGLTLRAVAHVVRRARPARLVAAVPIASRWGAQRIAREVDELSVVVTRTTVEPVSSGYENFASVSDDEILELLGQRRRRVSPTVRDISDQLGTALSQADGRLDHRERTILIPVASGAFAADLGMPSQGAFASGLMRSDHLRGLVILAHTNERDRNGFLSRYLAGRLRLGGYATLRLDLTTTSERRMNAGDVTARFEPARLTVRLAEVCDWVAREGVAGAQRTTLVGAGPTAGPAIGAAARCPGQVRAVIARGTRVDLPDPPLWPGRAAFLLIVGADKTARRQRDAFVAQLPAVAEVMRVPHTTHALEEPDAVGFVAERVVDWLDGLDRDDRKRLARNSRG